MRHAYTFSQIVEAYESLQLACGDNVFVTSGLAYLGLAPNCSSIQDICDLHLRAIRTVIGHTGTIFFPTYSYTFGKSQHNFLATFNVQTTLSDIGPFPNYFLTQKDVIRSVDPMVSVAGQGPIASSVLNNIPFNSYGYSSVFERLLFTGVKCISLGLGPNWTPFIHYLDYIEYTPFRYDKLFCGHIVNGSESLYNVQWKYSVPILNPVTDGNCHKLGRLAEAEGIWRSTILGKSLIYLCDYMEYFTFARTIKRNNPWITATGPERDLIRPSEAGKIFKGLSPLSCTGTNVTSDHTVSLSHTSSHIHSVADCLPLLSKTKRSLYIDYSAIVVGSNLFGYVVPESWQPLSLEIKDKDGTSIYSETRLEKLVKLIKPYSATVSIPIDKIPQVSPANESCSDLSTYFPHFGITNTFRTLLDADVLGGHTLEFNSDRSAKPLEYLLLYNNRSPSVPSLDENTHEPKTYYCIDTRFYSPHVIAECIANLEITCNTHIILGAHPFALLAHSATVARNPHSLRVFLLSSENGSLSKCLVSEGPATNTCSGRFRILNYGFSLI